MKYNFIFPLLIIIFYSSHKLNANPHNFTHKVKMTLSVDGEIKGDIKVT